MDFYFFDSSAVVKNYLNETGTAWIKSLITAIPSNEIYVSRLCRPMCGDGGASPKMFSQI